MSSLERGPLAAMRLGSRWLVSTRYRTAGERGRELERERREGVRRGKGVREGQGGEDKRQRKKAVKKTVGEVKWWR